MGEGVGHLPPECSDACSAHCSPTGLCVASFLTSWGEGAQAILKIGEGPGVAPSRAPGVETPGNGMEIVGGRRRPGLAEEGVLR